ncbi:hypothetical protein AERO9AM_10716 [Aeromicrobium sp. 9AM]|nr:hypothetical protein AERO9AM_10716 [Aeromicrobium sp. 9AM]
MLAPEIKTLFVLIVSPSHPSAVGRLSPTPRTGFGEYDSRRGLITHVHDDDRTRATLDLVVP